MIKYKCGFLVLICSYAISAVTMAEQQTYYTWTDVDGIIQITATPPPTNAEAQLHNVMEYESSEHLTPEQWRRRQLTQNIPRHNVNQGDMSHDVAVMRKAPELLTKKDQLRASARTDREQCREKFSDPNDIKQCISRVNYSLRLRLRLLKSENIVPDMNGASSGYEETTQ